nr:uncharacterized protein LOC127310589 [Lolium perenne]
MATPRSPPSSCASPPAFSGDPLSTAPPPSGPHQRGESSAPSLATRGALSRPRASCRLAAVTVLSSPRTATPRRATFATLASTSTRGPHPSSSRAKPILGMKIRLMKTTLARLPFRLGLGRVMDVTGYLQDS